MGKERKREREGEEMREEMRESDAGRNHSSLHLHLRVCISKILLWRSQYDSHALECGTTNPENNQ